MRESRGPGPAAERDFVGIVVAAGRSRRFGAGRAKQFLDLGGRSVLDRAIDALAGRPCVAGVVVVLAEEETRGPWAARLAARSDVLRVVAGGPTRADSVRAGLAACGTVPFVLVHDAARPLASAALVDAVIGATRRHGAAIPGLPVPDTVKRVIAPEDADPGAAFVLETLDRAALRLAQTPQGSRLDWLREALEGARDEALDPTDEAAALERAGRRVAVVPGDPANRKITAPDDLVAARRSGTDPFPDLRVGTGFDIHRLGAPRRLVLGGVEFPGEPGLEGHSDADVVLHAAMDALLGAAGLPDIGALFPPGDPRFAGADSRLLARDVAGRVAAAGFAVWNLDLTVLAERPRIRSSVERMREAIGEAFGLDRRRVGLKATTLEGLGALGRGEGIACQAVALLGRASAR